MTVARALLVVLAVALIWGALVAWEIWCERRK